MAQVLVVVSPRELAACAYKSRGRGGGAEVLASVGLLSLPYFSPLVVKKRGSLVTRLVAKVGLLVRATSRLQHQPQIDEATQH